MVRTDIGGRSAAGKFAIERFEEKGDLDPAGPRSIFLLSVLIHGTDIHRTLMSFVVRIIRSGRRRA